MAKRLRQIAGAVKQLPRSVRWSAAAAVGTFMLWLVLYAPSLFVPTPSGVELRQVDAAKRLELQNDVRTTLLQGLGGLAVLVGAFFTYRQLHTAREGQVTERFTRAIDQLGHEKQDIRLGGIYALEHIADDSTQDRATVVEVLPFPRPCSLATQATRSARRGHADQRGAAIASTGHGRAGGSDCLGPTQAANRPYTAARPDRDRPSRR